MQIRHNEPQLDKYGTDRYVGITKREPHIRFKEHLYSHTERSTLDYHEIQTGLTLAEARSIEQQWINQYGLMKNGGQLFNKINSIAQQYWFKYNLNIYIFPEY